MSMIVYKILIKVPGKTPYLMTVGNGEEVVFFSEEYAREAATFLLRGVDAGFEIVASVDNTLGKYGQ